MTHVLLVEDDEAIRDLVEAVLEDEGHRVRCARTGAEALWMACEQQPDLILTDIWLGRESGAAFIETYRQCPGAHARVVLLSGMTGLAEEAARLGAADYLLKPFDLDQLVSAVAMACPGPMSADSPPT
jgi:two-component system, NtrC family, nitrogen regulation response regulator NtrX